MAKYTMKQRVAYNQGLAKCGGTTGAKAQGYLQAVRDMNTAKRISAANAEKKAARTCENCGGKKK